MLELAIGVLALILCAAGYPELGLALLGVFLVVALLALFTNLGRKEYTDEHTEAPAHPGLRGHGHVDGHG